MKYGVECEGKFKGLYTLFMTSSELFDLLTSINPLIDKINKYKVQQVYILDEDYSPCKNLNETEVLILVSIKETTNVIITFELFEFNIPYKLCKYQHYFEFMLHIINADVFLMTNTNQIKISAGKDSKEVKVVCIENMYETFPDDYAGDIEIIELDI